MSAFNDKYLLLSRLFRNVLHFNSLEMSSADLIQVMPEYGVEPGCCIFSRGDLRQERSSSLSHGIVVFDRVLRLSGATH